jgi:hypothetical protein
MTFDHRVFDKRRSAASTDLVALVDALPGELDTGLAVPLDRAAVQPTADGDETELAGPSSVNSMKPGSTRSMASRSHPLISTTRQRPANGATDPGTPLAMMRQGSHRMEIGSRCRHLTEHGFVRSGAAEFAGVSWWPGSDGAPVVDSGACAEAATRMLSPSAMPSRVGGVDQAGGGFSVLGGGSCPTRSCASWSTRCARPHRGHRRARRDRRRATAAPASGGKPDADAALSSTAHARYRNRIRPRVRSYGLISTSTRSSRTILM